MPVAIEFCNISKIFPSNNLQACKNVCLKIQRGEILCIAGENGAGKSTLMKMLDGLENPSEGVIKIDGEIVNIKSPLDANKLKIGMVHQHFMLFDDFTVAQNVTMAIEPIKNKLFYDKKKAEEEVGKVIKEYGFSIDSKEYVGNLTIGQKQQTEIIKMLYRKVDFLILDEPTAVLTEKEIDALFDNLMSLKKEGKTIILITHKLKEIKRISDRVAIMKKGELVGVYDTSSLNEFEISSLMFDGGVSLGISRSENVFKTEKPVISFKNVTVQKVSLPRPSLDNVSFNAYPGEILGFAGVGGNGLGFLEGVLSGIVKVSSGKIFHKDKDITSLETKSLRKEGLSYVPSDRLGTGSAAVLSVSENLIISSLSEFTEKGILQKDKIEAFTKKMINDFSVSGTKEVPISSLSGGNIQKIILAREIERVKDYIIFSEPTWGLDISSSQFVYKQIERLRDKGVAILLISSNLEEILSLSDRIAIFCKGRIVKMFDNEGKISRHEIGDYMLAQKSDYKEDVNE